MDQFNPQAVVAVFQDTLTNHYFDMKGRVRRQTFWYFILACFVVGLLAAILTSILHLWMVSPIVSLALLLPMAGMGARRLQDIGRPGVLVWVLLIPVAFNAIVGMLAMMTGPFGALGFIYFFFTIGWLIGLIEFVALVALIYFWIQAGTVGPNEYGPDPKGAVAPAA